MTVDEPASRPLRKDAARNRAALVQAAREVFAERGLEASLDDIAHHAGLGVGTAYRHFANKYELAQAIFAEAIDGIVSLAELALTLDDPWDGIVGFLEGAAEAQSADRGLREVLMGVHDVDRIDEIHERLTEPLRALVERARQAGSIRADVEATDIGIVVLMLCTVADVTSDASPDLWRRYLPMLLNGLRADGGPTPSVPPLADDVLRKAVTTHKQRLMRAGQPPQR
jgi:AcrR family transcriptional regulator